MDKLNMGSDSVTDSVAVGVMTPNMSLQYILVQPIPFIVAKKLITEHHYPVVPC